MAEFTSFSGRKRQLAGDEARKAEFHEIPIISLTHPEPNIIEQLRDACTQVGFFYVMDHGVSQEVIDGIFETAERFFDQPLETKSEIHYKLSKVLHGYQPISEVRTDESKRADLNEAFNCEAAIHKESSMDGPNAWPRMPGFKQKVAAYYGQVLMLARRLARLFAQVLGLPATYFDSAVSRPGAMLRLLKYPAQDPNDPEALGIGAHTDIELFTILCQGSQPALQILNTHGQWIEAPPTPGTFVVNIADMLARWTNDVFISTVHRVHNCTGQERYSMPFFFGPSYDTMLRTLPTCVPDGETAGYQPISAGDYVWKRLAQSRLTEAEQQTFA
ncbi:hypothetical protein BST61_g1038 [Cercospora zeina]